MLVESIRLLPKEVWFCLLRKFRPHRAFLGRSDASESVDNKAIEGIKPSLKDTMARRGNRPTSLAGGARHTVPLDHRLQVREYEKRNRTTNTLTSTGNRIYDAEANYLHPAYLYYHFDFDLHLDHFRAASSIFGSPNTSLSNATYPRRP